MVCADKAGPVPVIVTTVDIGTTAAEIANGAEVELYGTVTVAGVAITPAPLFDSATVMPPDGAGLLNIAVPVAVPGPVKDCGDTESVNVSGTGFTVRVVCTGADRSEERR